VPGQLQQPASAALLHICFHASCCAADQSCPAALLHAPHLLLCCVACSCHLLLQMASIILLHEVQLGLGAVAKLSGGVTQGLGVFLGEKEVSSNAQPRLGSSCPIKSRQLEQQRM
jgi:hypothetical protein